MAKSKKKARNSKRPSRIDSTAGVVLSSSPSPSQPPPSSESPISSESSSPVAASAPIVATSSAPAPVEIKETIAALAETKPEVAKRELVKSESKIEPAKSESKIAAKRADASGDHNSADVSGDYKGFFHKPVDEIHLEELIKEAPELHDEMVVVAPRRKVDRRAHQLVIGILGFAAAIGIAGAVMRKATPRASAATSIVATPAAQAPAVQAPAALEPAAIAAVPAPAPAPVPVPEPVLAPAPAPAPEPVAAVPAAAAPTTAASAAAAPAVDEDEALTGSQLLSKARQAIAGGASSKAATYAKKAVAKGAGGSAYYVLGAAYQTMGSNGAAKGAYRNCAKSGCAEASECASLAEGL